MIEKEFRCQFCGGDVSSITKICKKCNKLHIFNNIIKNSATGIDIVAVKKEYDELNSQYTVLLLNRKYEELKKISSLLSALEIHF